MLIKLTLFVLWLIMFTSPAMAKELIYVQARQSKDIHIIDATTYEVLGTIDVGFPTDDVIGSPDGKMVYGNAFMPNGNPVGFPDTGLVYGVSTATNTIVWWGSIPGTPQHLSISRDGKRLFVPALNMNQIYVVDTATGRIVETWPSIIGNHGSELSKDGKRLYTGNALLGRIDVYDTETGRLRKVMTTRSGVRPFKFDDQEKYIYYQLSNFNGFEVRDIQSGDLVDTVNLPELSEGLHPDSFGTVNHGLAITPDGKKLVAAASLEGYVSVFSLPDLQSLGTIPVGEDPNWVRIRSDSKVAFVSNRGSNTVSVVDLETMKEITQVPAGSRPERFAIVDVE
ncbi:YncE family protein [Kineobactrum salinum]|uniref:Beta-propeller fold lactonase family protein n=1 Tax=Kineobactrum salinum TaxID=2708301 RepID=A0A6C0UAK5_9GAMM|nr:hypothetical protein [Kineobactrum salinum]QIB66894.1 hypothetical protein G3T16_17350 [Kineobactrum salinum]